MDGTRKHHRERGNRVTKEHTGYVLTDKRILGKKAQNIHKIILRPYEAQEEESPKCGYSSPS